jgi:hypothetical protein
LRSAGVVPLERITAFLFVYSVRYQSNRTSSLSKNLRRAKKNIERGNQCFLSRSIFSIGWSG